MREANKKILGAEEVPKFYNDPFLEIQFKKINQEPPSRRKKKAPPPPPAMRRSPPPPAAHQDIQKQFQFLRPQNPLIRKEEVILKLDCTSDSSCDM